MRYFRLKLEVPDEVELLRALLKEDLIEILTKYPRLKDPFIEAEVKIIRAWLDELDEGYEKWQKEDQTEFAKWLLKKTEQNHKLVFRFSDRYLNSQKKPT